MTSLAGAAPPYGGGPVQALHLFPYSPGQPLKGPGHPAALCKYRIPYRRARRKGKGKLFGRYGLSAVKANITTFLLHRFLRLEAIVLNF